MPFDLKEITEQFLLFLPLLITALVIFAASLFLAGLVSRAVRRALRFRKNSHKADDLIVKTVQISVVIFGAVVALQQIGFNVSAFLAGVGIIGFTIGFALQDVSKNFIAGLMLYLQQPFGIGDLIEVAGFVGRVEQIDLRDTQVHTLDGKLVLIPNAQVFSSPITNLSVFPTRRIDLAISVGRHVDLDVVSQAALDAIKDIPGVLTDPPAEVIFNKLGGAAIDFTLYFWIQHNQLSFLAAQDTAIRRIKTAFERAGIEVAPP